MQKKELITMKRIKVRPIRTESPRLKWPRWSLVLLTMLFVVPAFSLEFTKTNSSPKPATVKAAPKVTATRTKTAAKKGSWLFGLIPGVAPEPFFELDGDIAPAGGGGDDWLNVLGYTGPAPNAHLITQTGIVTDNGTPDNIFTGGSTGDTQDVSGWRWVARSGGPDKDDIQNGFAVAYRSDPHGPDNTKNIFNSSIGDLVIYAGGDRFDNSGDAQIGFWFMQQGCFPLSDGKFHTGSTLASPVTTHTVGDILILADFTNGGTNAATVIISVFRWDPTVPKTNLKQVGVSGPCPGGFPDLVGSGVFACGQQNLTNGTITPPWTYTNKSGSHSYGTNEFFEVGINVTQLLAGAGIFQEACVHTLLMETRASASVTSVLKDFLVHNFNVAPQINTIPDQTICSGSQATFCATVTGSKPPFTFTWKDAGNNIVRTHTYTDSTRTDCFQTGTAGTYSVTATDSDGCTSSPTQFATLTVDSISCSAAHTDESCSGKKDGTITVTATGNIGTVTYSKDGTTFQSSNVFTGLSAGPYTITVKDSTPCTSTCQATVSAASPVTLSLSETDTSCNGGNDGTITATFSGGKAPYQAQIDGGGYNPATSGVVFSNLTATSHTVDVKDANGCVTSLPKTVGQPPAIMGSATPANPKCALGNDGSITVNASGGTGTLKYSDDNGTTYVASSVFSGLTAGSYHIKVKDANSCVLDLGNTVLTDPAAIMGSATPANPKCALGNDGSITVNASGGTGTLMYSDDNGMNYGVSNVFSGLTAGSYHIKVKDANSCVLDLGSTVLSDPPAIMGSATPANPKCALGNDGSITVNASGGTGTLMYSDDNGVNYGASNVFSGLTAGSYHIKVKDDNNCVLDLGNVVLMDPAALTLSLTPQDTSCNGNGDGSVKVTFGGGTGPYMVSFNGGSFAPATSPATYSGLSAGSYPVTVKDANGCTISDSAMVNEGAAVTVSVITKVAAADGQSVTLSATSTGADTASWDAYDDHTCVSTPCGTLSVHLGGGAIIGNAESIIVQASDVKLYGLKTTGVKVGGNLTGTEWDLRVRLTVSKGNCTAHSEVTIVYMEVIDPGKGKKTHNIH